MTDYPGIDYGMGGSNIDRETGIRYGVISQHEVLQAWADTSESHYGEPDESLSEEEREEWMEFAEPLSWYVDDGEYLAECGEDGDIFITKSPYYSRAQFCSPCAPGAGYLMNECADGPKTYCFGHDWFEDGKAPYTVYRVADDSIVDPD